MTPPTLETIKETIRTLTPKQKRELRAWWDTQEISEPALTEDEIEQKLFEAGIIRRPRRRLPISRPTRTERLFRL